MTATLNDVAERKADEQSAEAEADVELVRLAKEQGQSLTGPDGPLKQLTKTVLETALNEEMTERLGYEMRDQAGILACSPARLLACSPARLLACSPARLLACSLHGAVHRVAGHGEQGGCCTSR